MAPDELDQWLLTSNRRPLVMGVLNVTPDSFSDGGKFFSPEAAVAHAEAMTAAGADLIDIGGESTRPGSQRVPAQEQLRRLVPVLDWLAGKSVGGVAAISIDTTLAAVAEAALDRGAWMINDISAGRDDPAMLPLAARRGAPIVLMHMRGQPKTMQHSPAYADVAGEVAGFFRERLSAAIAAGIDPKRVLFDPGIGFGKTLAHNLELLQKLRVLADLGHPIVVGTSRKHTLTQLAASGGGEAASVAMSATAATVAWAVANGAAIVRVHEPGPMSQVVRVIGAIDRSGS
ncbi:MAG TPA: dihydropteroate synthase [Tepidisphaeraceae bacterium]|nr:dihydropteroate synthase [Tepidisphaeraceae bacterium]